MVRLTSFLTLLMLFGVFSVMPLAADEGTEKEPVKIALVSPVFQEDDKIPVKYTCDGDDVSPPLSWSKVPEGTKSFAIVYTNRKKWTYWILYNIPPAKRALPEATPRIKQLPDGSIQGINSEKWIRYVGPCPPFSQRSFFKISALDTMLELGETDDRKALDEAMAGHILGEGKLTGKYARRHY